MGLRPEDRVLLTLAELAAICLWGVAVLPCHPACFSAAALKASGPGLRIFANPSVGADHVDPEAARVAMCLCVRGLEPSGRLRSWRGEVSGKRFGIAGTGRVGQVTAERAR